MRTVHAFSCLVLVVLSLSASVFAAPEGWVIEQITNGGMISFLDGGLSVDGNQVVYIEGGQVILWATGQTSHQISSGQYKCWDIQTSDGQVVWKEGSQVIFWNCSIPQQLSSVDNSRSNIHLSGGKVAWLEYLIDTWQVMFWDGQITRQLSSGKNNRNGIQLSEGMVGWEETIDGKTQMMLWDGTTTKLLSSGQYSCSRLNLSEGNAAWIEYIQGKGQVYFWDGQKTQQLSTGQQNCDGNKLSEGNVVWLESINDKYQVKLWDSQIVRQLSSGQNDCVDVYISKKDVLWIESFGGVHQLMYWDGNNTIQLTRNIKNKSSININDGAIVWAESNSALGFPRTYVYCWKDGQKDLLGIVEVGPVDIRYLSASSSVIAWIGPDSIDDLQVYVAMRGESQSVIKGPEGDVNRDLKVDLSDLAIVSASWLGNAKERIAGEMLDRNPGWAIQGPWWFGRPTGMGGTEKGNPDPQDGVTGRNVYGVNLFGDYPSTVGGPYNLTAGPFDCSGYEKVELAFSRWLNTDSAEYVQCTVEVSHDGINWQTIWTNPTGTVVFDSEWQAMSYGIGETADGQTKVWVRWTHRVLSDRAYSCSGWNIDDVELWGEKESSKSGFSG